MLFKLKSFVPLASLFLVPLAMHAQFNFNVEGRQVQIHSFLSQGFAYSNDNDYLTMKTSQGSFAMTDAAVNISAPVTDKFRVGAQVYFRRLGELSSGQVTLDWAVADYRFKEWFGIRGGKVKTALGLYNDTQDMSFLHTFAMLPQAMYPLDLRSSTIAHNGGDIYGSIPVKKLGTFSYTVYGGMRPDDAHDGYRYFLGTIGIPLNNYTGKMLGGDMRWATPVNGLLMGASYLAQHPHGTGANGIYQTSRKNQVSQFYVQYTKGNFRIDGEYRRDYRDQFVTGVPSSAGPPPGGDAPTAGGGGDPTWNSRSWYIAPAYRISRVVEVGGYYSQYVPNWTADHSANDNHIYDKVLTVRFDVKRYWNVKLEGHLMDGYGSIDSARGFYTASGAGIGSSSFQPKTNMVIVRTCWYF